MNTAMKRQFIKLTEFLGKILGPDYEIALHDLSNKQSSIIALANGHISGRNLDSPLSANAMQILSDRSYETKDYRINYSGVAVGKKLLRTSTFYIKDDGNNIVGMLCINFDDSRYQDISNQVLKLCHPDAFVDANFVYNMEKSRIENLPASFDAENFQQGGEEIAGEMLKEILTELQLNHQRLNKEEKKQIVDRLQQRGVFLIKGAVKQIAAQLNCSQASIYRYLKK